jgi:hypothetical protein
MEIIYWIVTSWFIIGLIAAVLFGVLSDSGQHDDMISGV